MFYKCSGFNWVESNIYPLAALMMYAQIKAHLITLLESYMKSYDSVVFINGRKVVLEGLRVLRNQGPFPLMIELHPEAVALTKRTEDICHDIYVSMGEEVFYSICTATGLVEKEDGHWSALRTWVKQELIAMPDGLEADIQQLKNTLLQRLLDQSWPMAA